MKRYALIIIPMAMAAIFSLNGNYYAWQVFMGLAFGAFIGTMLVYQKLGLPLALCWGWTMFSLLSVSYLPDFNMIIFKGQAEGYIRNSAITGIIFFLLATMPYLVLDVKRFRQGLIYTLAAICAIDSILVLGEWAVGQDEFIRGGFFFNASLNSCMISGLLPFYLHTNFFKIKPIYKVILPLLAVIASGSTGGFGAFMLAVGAYFFFAKKRAYQEWVIVALGLVLIGIFAYFYLGQDRIFTTSGRMVVWKNSFYFWKRFANMWIGFGQGSAMQVVPVTQKLFQQDSNQVFLWMHNEWYQVLFEQGIIGLVLWLYAYLHLLVKTFLNNEKYITVAIIVFGFVCLFNYPFRMAIPGMIMASLFFLATTSRRITHVA